VEAEHPHEHHYPSLVTRPYVVLDHLWRFATRFAESPDSPWLERAELANAIGKLCDLGKKAAKDRGLDLSIVYAAKQHARACLEVKEGRRQPSYEDAPVASAYRSLGSASYSQRNYVPEMVPSAAAAGSTHSVGSKRARETEAYGEGEPSAAAYRSLPAAAYRSLPQLDAACAASHAGLRKEHITDELVKSARDYLDFLDYLQRVGD
jgi:hypothetical protein